MIEDHDNLISPNACLASPKQHPSAASYQLVHDAAGQGILCLHCGLMSHNAADVQYQYCGACHRFH